MKLKTVCLALLTAIWGLSLNFLTPAQQTTDLIGYQHAGVRYGEKLANGARDQGGGLLSDENYGVTRFSKGSVSMLWFEKITGRNKAGVPFWQVLDVLSFPGLKKDREFLFSYSSSCRRYGRENLDLIVLAEPAPRTGKYIPLKAWLADVQTGRFKTLPLAGIVCR